MGKCVSNKIGHPFSFGFDVVTGLWQDMITTFWLIWNVLVDLAQIKGVSRCNCQHCG